MPILARHDQEIIANHFFSIAHAFTQQTSGSAHEIDDVIRELTTLAKPHYFDDDLLRALNGAQEELARLRNTVSILSWAS